MKNALLIFLILGGLFSCKKDPKINSCFDPSIVHNGPCPADCPGVKGCDGKTYCNECEAARKGIRVVK